MRSLLAYVLQSLWHAHPHSLFLYHSAILATASSGLPAMPKVAATRQSRRLAPYDHRMAPSISTPIPPYLAAMSHTAHEWQPAHMYPTPNMHHPMGETMNPIASSHHPLPQPCASPQPAQSGPWSTDEDDLLFQARSQSLSWSQIQEQYFPTKSANACRKRYERLNVKRRSNDWDDARLERLAMAYVDMRAQLWQPLAERLGEKWEHVEKAVSLVLAL